MKEPFSASIIINIRGGRDLCEFVLDQGLYYYDSAQNGRSAEDHSQGWLETEKFCRICPTPRAEYRINSFALKYGNGRDTTKESHKRNRTLSQEHVTGVNGVSLSG